MATVREIQNLLSKVELTIDEDDIGDAIEDLNNKLPQYRKVRKDLEAKSTENSKKVKDIADKLDAKDGKVDGKISASIWNEYGISHTKQDISIDDAENAIHDMLETSATKALREFHSKQNEEALLKQKRIAEEFGL